MAPKIDDHGVMIVDRINPPSIFVFRLLRCLQFTSHSRNPQNHRRLNGTTTSFQTTKALLLLHAPLGVLIGRIMEAVNTIRILLSRLAIQNSGS